MERKLGLYVTLGNDGSLKRTSVSISGETELEATTLNDEVILFSELIFDFYAFIVDRIRLSAAYLVTQDGDGKDTVDMRVFEFIQDTVQDLIEEFEEDDPLYGTLTRTIMEDRIPAADGSGTYPVTAVEKIISELSAVMLTQFSVNNILRDMRFHVPIDLDKKYRSLQEVEFTQISSFSNLHTPEYLFRSAADYYTFLVLHFIAAEPRVALCECCGRYFIPKTAKKTLYCDRVLKDDKTCKDLGPALKHINARLENARKDAIYAEAQSKMDGGDASTYSEAIALFQSIPEWKDAEAQISICQKKIEEIETKEESNRLEAERKEGERKIAAEKAAKKRKKIVIIAAPIVSVCAIIAIVVTTVIIPSNKYKQGLELLKQQKYDEAYAVFSSLNYKDSEEKMTLAEEMQQLEAGQFDEALEILDSLRDTENIDEILTEYFDKNSENLFNKKQYAGFVALCERTGTHPKNYEEAYYQVGILKMGSGDLTDACNAFSTVRGYKKADEYYNLCTFYDKYDGLWGLDGVFTTIYGTGWDYTTPGEVETMYWNFSPYEGQEPARFYIAPNGVVTADLWGVYDIGSRACSVNGTTVKATDTFSSDGKNYYREFSFDLETKTSHSVTYNADGSMHQTKDAHYALKG